MTDNRIDIKFKKTWVFHAALFVCRHIRSKTILRLLCYFTAGKVYANDKLIKRIKLGDWIKV